MDSSIIGILAGMGPNSTAPFLEAVYDECRKQYGARYDIDFPEIVLVSKPTPFYLDREIDHKAMLACIRAGVKRLEDAGSTIIAIPCNSAQRYYSELTKTSSVPIMDIVTETLCEIETDSSLTLFATSHTFDTNLYQENISNSGRQFVFDESWQYSINGLIDSIKSNSMDDAKSLARDLSKDVVSKGINTVILGCTELTELSPIFSEYVRVVDSSRCLARALVLMHRYNMA